MTLSDQQFLEMFENCTLPPEQFNHFGHLRLAWLYLNIHPLETAIDKTASGICAYAGSLGATDKFQHTLTEAIVRIMADRLARGRESSLEAYLTNNDDLLNNIGSAIAVHYSEERLRSESAGRRFVSPDRKPFETENTL